MCTQTPSRPYKSRVNVIRYNKRAESPTTRKTEDEFTVLSWFDFSVLCLDLPSDQTRVLFLGNNTEESLRPLTTSDPPPPYSISVFSGPLIINDTKVRTEDEDIRWTCRGVDRAKTYGGRIGV